MTFAKLLEEFQRDALWHVDAREWTEDWLDGWVAFVDLIGFGYRNVTSPPAALNQIVRFHRVLSRTAGRYEDLRVHRFTDAAYLVAERASQVVKASADILHGCLAMNVVQYERGRREFHRMVVPRITLGRGQVLAASGELDHERSRGVDSDSLLLGPGLISAYAIEKRSAGSLLSYRQADHEDLARALELRGPKGPTRRSIETWVMEPDRFAHDHIVDLPWIVLQADQSAYETVDLEEKDAARGKATHLYVVSSLQLAEYVMGRLSSDVMKQLAGVQRHLADLAPLLYGQKRRPTTLKDLEELLQV